jgi:hypothetical protein
MPISGNQHLSTIHAMVLAKYFSLFKEFPEQFSWRAARKTPNLIALTTSEELRQRSGPLIARIKWTIFRNAIDLIFKLAKLLSPKQFRLTRPESHSFTRSILVPQANQLPFLLLFPTTH